MDFKKRALRNRLWLKQVFYSPALEVTVMHIPVGEDIGWEVHETQTQMTTVASGIARVQIGKKVRRVRAGQTVVVPKGTRHNVWNVGRRALKIWTVYTPHEHGRGKTIRRKVE